MNKNFEFTSFTPSETSLFRASSFKSDPVTADPDIYKMGIEILSDFGEQLQEVRSPLSYCPLTEEEIERDSLLKNFPISNIPNFSTLGTSQEEMLLSILANFLGSGLVTGKELQLDGLNPNMNFCVWEWLLQDVRKSVQEEREEALLIDSLLYDIEKLKAFTEEVALIGEDVKNGERLVQFSETCVKEVKKLNRGESYVFYGGWSNEGIAEGGHAHLYEFFRNENDSYNLNVYNSTGFQLADIFNSGDKQKLSPVIRYENISEERLFFNSDGKDRSEFIQHLIEIQVIRVWDHNREMESEDVLEWLDYLKEDQKPVEGAVTGQRGGTCAPSVTKKWFRNRMQNPARFKQLNMHLSIRLIIGAYRVLEKTISEDSSLGSKARHVLKVVTKNQLLALHKCIEGFHGAGPLLDETLGFKFQATFYDLLQTLHKEKKAIKEKRKVTGISSGIDTFDTSIQRQKRERFSEHFPPSELNKEPEKADFRELPPLNPQVITMDEEGITRLDFDALHQSITLLAEYAQKETKDCISLNLAIHELVNKLPLPKVEMDNFNVEVFLEIGGCPALDALTYEEKERLLNDIALLTSFYEGSDDTKARAYATLLPLYAITHYLSIKVEREKLGIKAPPAALLTSYALPKIREILENFEAMIYYDQNEYLRIQESISYLHLFSAKTDLKEPLFGEEGNVKVEGFEVKTTDRFKEGLPLPNKRIPNGDFWKALLTQDPSLNEALKEEANQRWPNLTENEIEEQFLKDLREYNIALKNYQKNRSQNKGLPPEHPKKRVNLPETTKCVMLLEEMVHANEETLLHQFGYGYIVQLRSLAFLVQKDNLKPLYKDHCCAERTAPHDYNVKVKKAIAKIRPEKNRACLEEHRSFKPKHSNFFGHEEVRRWELSAFDRSKAEGEITKTKIFRDPFLNKLLRTASEPTLTPYQLIMEFDENLEKLLDPSMQALFFRLFFRSPVSKKGTKLGAGALLLKDPALREASSTFIHKGLKYFYQERRENGIKGARFFLELSFYISKYLHDGGKEEYLDDFSVIPYIDQWLNKEGLGEQEFSILHRYRFLHFSLTFFEQHEEHNEALVAAYTSLIASRVCDDRRRWSSPMIEKFIDEFAARLNKQFGEVFAKEEGLCTALAKNVLNTLELPYASEGLRAFKEETSTEGLINNLLHIESGGDSWTIDLLAGELFHQDLGIVSKGGGRARWEGGRVFERLFSEETNFSYTALGNGCYTFCHPKKGNFRIYTKRQYSIHSIQRQFPEVSDQWFEHMFQFRVENKEALTEDDDRNLHGIPSILQKDHTWWIPITEPINTETGENIVAYIADLEEQKLKYALDTAGKIVEVYPENGQPKEEGEVIDYANPAAEIKQIFQFDLPENILVSRDHCTENVDTVMFCRYASQVGNPLHFTQKEGKIVWSENQAYYIPEQTPQGYLGEFQNFLFLTSEEEDAPDKLLIPFQKMEFSGELEIENERTLIDLFENRKEQWGVFPYFIFDIVNENVRGTTLESRIFLAYLLFSQKKYSQAVRIFSKMKPTETLSPLAMRILKLLMTAKLHEDHPDEKMVQLHALYIYAKEMDRTSKEKVSNYFHFYNTSLIKLSQNYCTVLGSINNISQGCAFTIEQEKKVATLLADFLDQKMKMSEHNQLKYAPYWEQITQRLAYLKTEKKEERNSEKIHRGRRVFPESTSGRFRSDVKRISLYNFLCRILYKPYISQLRSPTTEEKTRLQQFLDGAARETAWLSFERPLPLLVAYPNKEEIEKNGTLFLTIYQAAKNGSPSERRAWVYRLKQWRIRQNSYSGDPFIDLLMTILIQPEHFPELIDINIAEPEEKYNFLNIVQEIGGKRFCQPYTINGFLNSPTKTHTRSAFGVEKEHFDQPYSMLDQRECTVEDIASKPELFPLRFNEPIDRWNTLESWKETFLEPLKREELEGESFSFTFEETFLSDEEQEFRAAFENDLETRFIDYNAGEKQIQDKEWWTLSKTNGEALLKQTEKSLKKVKVSLEVEEQNVLDLLNRWKAQSLQESTLLGGGNKRLATYDDCIVALLSMDGRAFKLWNPHLSQEEIKLLVEKILEVEEFKSYQAQLSHIRDKCQKVIAIEDLKSPVRCYACQELATFLDARYHFEKNEEEGIDFNLETQLVLRVFAGETGMIPYKKQAQLISRMVEVRESNPSRFKDIVIQLIMGGGKTTLIGSIVLYLAATRKREKGEGSLALFLLPDPLVDTVKENCSESLKNGFKKELLSFEIKYEDLNLYTLKQVEKTLKRALKKSEPLILKASNFHCIELGLLTLARKIKKSAFKNKIVDRIDIKKLEKLATIWSLFAENSDALMDEIDILLNCLRETNFPEGEVIPIDGNENALIEQIYKTLVSQEISIPALATETEEAPKIAEFVGLCTNEQTTMPTEIYKKEVTPIVAEAIVEKFDPIKKMVIGFKESFIRYTTGGVPATLQRYADDPTLIVTEESLEKSFPKWRSYYHSLKEIKNDLSFIKYLREMFYKGSKKQKEAANLIALTQHLLCEITPSTLGKNGKRDYGRKPNAFNDSQNIVREENSYLSIIPYLAVNVPATTEFGYYLEEACYYYQWLAAMPLEESDIKEIAEEYEASARYYVKKNEELYEETVEYQFFQEFFGVSLDEIHKPEVLAIAVKTLAEDPAKRLELGYDIVAQKVERRSERLSANGVTLISQLGSSRTMSGTPWNVGGYLKRLVDRYVADLGTEGKILHTLAKKSKPEHLHEVEFKTVETFIEKTFQNHPAPHKIRGIIEAGGLFNIFRSNKKVAKELMKALEKRNPEIEGVLFFHKDKGQKEPDTLYIWKRGAKNPERIGGSSKESLKAKGLDPSKYFVYYDERHTTGVDILQTPDAINLFTFDEKMTIRNIGQGAMRLRQLLFFQSIEFVTTPKVRELLINRGETLQDWILSAQKNETIKKTKDMVRHFKQQIDNIFRFPAVKAIVEAALHFKDPHKFAQTVKCYEPFFVTNTVGENYLLHGRLKLAEDTKEMLCNSLKDQWNLFYSIVDDSTILEEVENGYNELLQHIQETSVLPTEWKSSKDQLGVEQEVEVAAEVDEKIDVDLTIEEELLLELQSYNAAENLVPRTDNRWSEKGFLSMIQEFKDGKEPLISLQQQLAHFQYGFRGDVHPFELCFTQKIYGTDSYFNPYRTEIPIFHRAQKPAKQILCIQTEWGVRWILASEFEAKRFRQHLKTLAESHPESVEGVWMIQPDGSSFLKRETPFPATSDPMVEGLMELNAFSGNMKYFNKYPDAFEEWIFKGKKKLKVHFLKLRTIEDPKNYKFFRSNPYIQEIETTSYRDSSSQQMLRARQDRESNRKGHLHIDPIDVKLISLMDGICIGDLNEALVEYLGLDWNRRDEDPVTAKAFERLAEKLNEEKFPKGSENWKKELQRRAEELNIQVFHRLKRFQVGKLLPEQMQWLPPEKVSFLKTPDQIYRVEESKPVYFLTKEQMDALDEHQAHFIPFVNPKFYSEFDEPWQIVAIPVEHLDKIQPIMWNSLSKEQVKNLEEGIERLPRPEQYGWLHGNLLEIIPKEYLCEVTKEQIREITNISILQRLESIAATAPEELTKGTWTSWLKAEQIPSIDFENQLRYLRGKKQIGAVPNEQVKYLNPEEQVYSIQSYQVPFLEGREQIQNTPLRLANYFDPIQVPEITEDHVRYLRDPRQIQAINNAKLFSCLSMEQMFEIADEQLPLVQVNQVEWLNNRQLLELVHRCSDNWELTLKGLSKDQVESFGSQELIDLLAIEQINKWLQRGQLPFLLTEWQVQACPNALLEFLSTAQLQHVSPNQIPFLTNEQLIVAKTSKNDEEWIAFQEQISPKRMRTFNSKELIDLLSTEQKVTHLEPHHVRFFENDELLILKASKNDEEWTPFQKQIPPETIRTFNSKELVDLLSTEQKVTHLEPNHVHFFENDELLILKASKNKEEWTPFQEQIPPETMRTFNSKELINLLSTEQKVTHLEPHHVPFFENDELLILRERKEHPEEYFAEITEDQIQTFDSQELIDLLNQRQIGDFLQEEQVPFLQTEEQVQACPAPLLDELSIDTQIAKISDAQLKNLRNREQIRTVSWHRVPVLTRNQLRKRSWKQFLTYTVGVLTLGVAASVVSLIACITIIPVVYAIQRDLGNLWFKKALTPPRHVVGLFQKYCCGV